MALTAPEPRIDPTQAQAVRRRWPWRRSEQGVEQVRLAGSARPRAGRRSSGDLLLVAGGIALGLTCAFFPWYVFFNQDQFGIRAVKFGGNPGTGTVPAGSVSAGHIEAPIAVQEATAPELDELKTGTLRGKNEPEPAPPGLAEQPFPAVARDFKLVHIANGRAMIEDESGLWLVQRGSILPDNTKVTAIVQRDDRWVVLTSGNNVLEVTR